VLSVNVTYSFGAHALSAACTTVTYDNFYLPIRQ